MIPIGQVDAVVGDEVVAGKGAHRLQDPFVAKAPTLELILHHDSALWGVRIVHDQRPAFLLLHISGWKRRRTV